MTDLTPERLNELERDWQMWVKYDDPTAGLLGALGKRAPAVLTLIAMARDKQAAERERDAYMALADTKAAEVAALERERDALRDELELWRAAALASRNMLSEAGVIGPIDGLAQSDAGGE